ncbi:hypothetical protein GCM10023220_68520 [Streptomyces ziwulingensis]|uniref:Transposase IS701-like DDE domain-containing protein n=1 Tax=Streptomyces ziwulingensis TaxID=1045501 RepID=A0ABP9D2J2_9ACTN
MGRVENVIVAVYTTYATKRGHALIDRDLYVQADWFADPARMATAYFPKEHAFATKPALALAQAKRALAAGIRPEWATGDEVYGRSRELREFLEGAGIGYVLSYRYDPLGQPTSTQAVVGALGSLDFYYHHDNPGLPCRRHRHLDLHARQYNTATGRFTRSDPAATSRRPTSPRTPTPTTCPACSPTPAV